MRKRPIWCNRNVMELPFFYCLVLTERQYLQETKRLGVSDPGLSVWARRHEGAEAFLCRDKEGKLCCIVSLNETVPSEPIQTATLLMHEAVHIWQHYEASLGYIENVYSKEFEAWSIQYIAQQLLYAYVDMKGLR